MEIHKSERLNASHARRMRAHTRVAAAAAAAALCTRVTHLFVTPGDILQLFENFTVYSAG